MATQDERTPWTAFSKLVEAIEAVPEDAWITDVTLGRRRSDSDRCWYWNVTWAMSAGTVTGGYQGGRPKALALEDAAVQLIELAPRMDTCPTCGAVLTPEHYHPAEGEE